jgi:multiple sugar transport system substrate-binding protein
MKFGLKSLVAASIAVALQGAAMAAELRVAINQSPWLDGFSKTAQAFEKQTGHKVVLSITPYFGLLEKIRNSLRSSSGQYDLVLMDSIWLAEVYGGGFLTPITKVNPSFKLDPAVADFGDSLYWDPKRSLFRKDSGDMLGLPITGNVQLMYYRKDMFDAAGLKAPRTWDDVRAASDALKGKVEYPYVTAGVRELALNRAVPYMMSAGGGVFKNPGDGDYTVIFNSKESLEGLKAYIDLVKRSHPNPGANTIANVSQLISTGKAAMTTEVAALWGAINNPNNSIAAGKLAVAPHPIKAGGVAKSSSTAWVGGIPKNVSPEQQKLSLEFMTWLLKKENQAALFENGSVPVRTDLVGAAKDPHNVLPALSAAFVEAEQVTPVKEGAQIYNVLGLHINRALTGERTPEQALNEGAKELYDLMKAAGYKTAVGKDL